MFNKDQNLQLLHVFYWHGWMILCSCTVDLLINRYEDLPSWSIYYDLLCISKWIFVSIIAWVIFLSYLTDSTIFLWKKILMNLQVTVWTGQTWTFLKRSVEGFSHFYWFSVILFPNQNHPFGLFQVCIPLNSSNSIPTTVSCSLFIIFILPNQ